MILKIVLPIMALVLCSCANTKTASIDSNRKVAQATTHEASIHTVTGMDSPVDVYLHTEYRGTFVSGVRAKDCSGSISLWFFKDSDGKLMYYSKGHKADLADCKIILLGDLADKSQGGMDACAGVDFNYKVVDLEKIGYLREINFVDKNIGAPVCDKGNPTVVKEVSRKLKLKKFKTNGINGTLHLQIALPIIPKVGELKMNYYITPMINID